MEMRGYFFVKKSARVMLVIGESCPRPRFRVAESSIHTFRILLITVESSVVYADTSKNEATWYKVLLHLRCKIIFNPKSIRGMVTWTAFYINRNSADNLYVRYLYFNEVSQTWNSNYYNVRNKFNSNNPAAVAGNSLYFSPFFMRGEFSFSSCFTICPFHPPSIFPTSSIFSDIARYFLLSSDLVSQRIMRSTFNKSVFLMVCTT